MNPKPPPKFNQLIYADIAQRRARGETLASIAADYGVTVQTISRKLQRWARQQRHDAAQAQFISDRSNTPKTGHTK